MALDTYNTIMIDCENTIVKEGIQDSASPILPGTFVHIDTKIDPVDVIEPIRYVPTQSGEPGYNYVPIGIVVEDQYVGALSPYTNQKQLDVPYEQGQRIFVKHLRVGDVVLAWIGGSGTTSEETRGSRCSIELASGTPGMLDVVNANPTYRIFCQLRYDIPFGLPKPLRVEVVIVPPYINN